MNALRTLVALIVAVSALSLDSQAEVPTGAEERWETNWESFLETIQRSMEKTDLLSETPLSLKIGSFVMPLDGPTMSQLANRVEGRTVTWTGSISNLADDWSNPHIDLAMPPKLVKLKDGSSGMCCSLRLTPGPDQISQWKTVKVGDSVRFKTVLKRGKTFPVVGVFLGKDKEKGKAVVIISTDGAELVEVLVKKGPAAETTGEKTPEATKTAEEGARDPRESSRPIVTKDVSPKGVKDLTGISPSVPVWCVFEGIRLRNKPYPSATGEYVLHEGQKLLKTDQVGDVWRIKTDTDEGWMHGSAFTESREVAKTIASYNPKPNALFVVRQFSGPSSFQLELWHGGLKAPSVHTESTNSGPEGDPDTPQLQPGNCIVLTVPTPHEYSGPYQVFGHRIPSEQAGILLILDNAGRLIDVQSSRPSPQLLVPIIVTFAAILAALLVGRFVCSRRTARHRSALGSEKKEI